MVNGQSFSLPVGDACPSPYWSGTELQAGGKAVSWCVCVLALPACAQLVLPCNLAGLRAAQALGKQFLHQSAQGPNPRQPCKSLVLACHKGTHSPAASSAGRGHATERVPGSQPAFPLARRLPASKLGASMAAELRSQPCRSAAAALPAPSPHAPAARLAGWFFFP